MVGTAIHDLRAMPPEQREKIIASPRFRGMFSDQERDMMRGATRLPLAPPEGAETGPSAELNSYERSIFLAIKKTFAGRSPNRRMKYGYHSAPNGT